MAAGPPTVQQIYGPMLIGSYLSVLLYGVTLSQMFTYFQTSRKDPLWMKALIFYLFVAITANSGFDIAMLYEPLVLRFGDQLFTRINSPVFLIPDAIVTVAISTPVQIFMAWRIKVLTGSTAVALIIIALSIASFAGGTWTTLAVAGRPQFQSFQEFRAAPTTWLVTSAVADVAITISLAYSLTKKKTGFSQMDNYIQHIIIITVQTGMITAIAALADALVFLTVPGTTVFFIWDLSLSKLYASTILSSLNARNSMKRVNMQQAQNALFGSSEIGVSSISHQQQPTNPGPIELGHMKGQGHMPYDNRANYYDDAQMYGMKISREVHVS